MKPSAGQHLVLDFRDENNCLNDFLTMFAPRMHISAENLDDLLGACRNDNCVVDRQPATNIIIFCAGASACVCVGCPSMC